MIRSLREYVCAAVSSGRVLTGLVCVAVILTASFAQAATFFGQSIDGHPTSAAADFSLVGDTLTVVLTNTTATTLDAGELLTGIDFSVSGLTPTLTTATGVERTVETDGSFNDLGSVDLLAPASWSLFETPSAGSGVWRLDFNPTAAHGILGPPSGGDYSGANGSIKVSGGHEPFIAETATFEIDVPGLSGAPLPQVVAEAFLFGTGPDPGTSSNGPPITPGGGPEAPEPASIALLLLGAAVIGVSRRRHA